MEIRIDTNELHKSISRVQSIIEKRTNMPILSMVLLSGEGSELTVSATDLEISFEQRVPAQVIEPGSITISGRKLFEIVKETKTPTIHIKEKENNWIFIYDGKARYNLAGLAADEYPVFMKPEGVTTVQIPSIKLTEMIKKTIFSVTMEDAGFKLSGVLTEKVTKQGKDLLRMVSTDGHRLSLIEKDLGGIGSMGLVDPVVIPKKGMQEINKLASETESVQIGFSENNCLSKNEDTTVIIRLLDTRFPNYNEVIPVKTEISVRAKREELLDAMKKMVILSSESFRGVTLSLEENGIELVSINPDIGDAQEKVDIAYRGEKLQAGFNPRYFIEALQVMESEVIELGFVDASSPCFLRGESDEGFLALIMPMRI